jgi:hypothetical protein
MPFYTLVPPQSKYPELSGHAWVPMDDETTLCIMFSYTPAAPLDPRSRELFEEGHNGRETGHASRHCYVSPRPGAPYADYWTKFGPSSDFLFDYASQQTTWFSGLPGLWVQDAACQTGIAPIYDRSRENLCASDTGIVMTRRLLLEAVKALRDRQIQPGSVADPEIPMVRAVSLRLAEGLSWAEEGREHMRAGLGKDFGYEP